MARPQSEPSDAFLLSRSAAGDNSAFRRLMSRHVRLVFRTALRCTGSRQDAEDITQEVFLQVWRKAGDFRGRAEVSTWLYRIVINRCLNHKRKHRRDPLSMGGPAESRRSEDPAADPQEAVLRREGLGLVSAALSALPGRQRTALVLSQLDGRSYREVAEILGTTVPAVESLIFRARMALRYRLKGLQVAPSPDREAPPHPP